MKKIWCICLVGLAIISCAACLEQPAPDVPEADISSEAGEATEISPDQDAFIMSTVEESYPADTQSIMVTIFNQLPYEGTTSLSYELEYFDSDSWIPVELSFPVDDALVILAPHSPADFSVSLYHDQYSYEAGAYRVKKIIEAQDDIYEVYAEFSLVIGTAPL